MRLGSVRTTVLERLCERGLLAPRVGVAGLEPACGFSEEGGDPGIKPMSLMSPALAGGFFTTSATREAPDP